MDEDLKKLVEELRRETCPQRVIDEVARRLPGKQPSRLRIEFAAACTAVLLLAGWGLWRLSEDRVLLWLPIQPGLPARPKLL